MKNWIIDRRLLNGKYYPLYAMLVMAVVCGPLIAGYYKLYTRLNRAEMTLGYYVSMCGAYRAEAKWLKGEKYYLRVIEGENNSIYRTAETIQGLPVYEEECPGYAIESSIIMAESFNSTMKYFIRKNAVSQDKSE